VYYGADPALFEQDSPVGENILGLTFTKKARAKAAAGAKNVPGARGRITLTRSCVLRNDFARGSARTTTAEQVDHWILCVRNMRRLQLDQYRSWPSRGNFLTVLIQFFFALQDETVSCEKYKNTRKHWPRSWKRNRLQMMNRRTRRGWKK